MERPKTYFGFLDSIAGNADAIESEKRRLDLIIAQVRDKIRKRLTAKTVPGLLWYLAIKELERIAPLVGLPLSDFAGHARFLRALCAGVRFESVELSHDPEAEELLKECEVLWPAMFHREMLEDPRLVNSTDVDQRHMIAGMTSLLGAIQRELTYDEDVEARVGRVFSPFSSEIIEPALGISTADIIKAFCAVRNAIPERMEEYVRLMQPVRDLDEESQKRARAGESLERVNQFISDHPDYDDINKKVMAGVRALHEMFLFRPDDFREELGEHARAFLEAFSFIPGEANTDLRTPYDDDIVRRRPFAQIADDQFVLVDPVYASHSPPHRLVECFDTERKLQRLNKRRDESLEDEAFTLFNSVVQADRPIRNYFVPVGKEGDLAERDLLLVKNNCAFAIESKARPLRAVNQRRDKLQRIETDVKRSIQEGYDQACGVIRHIQSGHDAIPIFDSDGAQMAQLNVEGIDQFFPIVLLDSYYGLVATDLGPWLNLDEDIGFPWVVDRDTFASIILKIDSFEKLRTFLEWRRTLHGIAFNEDEAVFAGCFLTHGPFQIPKKADLLQLNPDYAEIFEAEYFRRKGIDVKAPPENIGPPVFSTIQRVGDEITFKIDGEVDDVINIQTGESQKRRSRKRPSPAHGKVGRNDQCPCGSGKKFKKCCIPLG